MIKKFLFILTTVFFYPIVVFGQQIESLQILLSLSNSTIYRLTVVILFLAFLFFLWGMAIFILNAGSEEKRTDGKQKMIWGIIALAVMIGVWGIIKIIQFAFFGDTSLNLPLL